MSGIDEQIADVPVCPLCKERPSFWVLYPTMVRTGEHGWYWLHSDKYLKLDLDSEKLVSASMHEGKSTTLDEIMQVVCHPQGGPSHIFTSKHPTFHEALQLARRLEK